MAVLLPSPSWGKLQAFSSLFLSSTSDSLSGQCPCGGFASHLQAKPLPVISVPLPAWLARQGSLQVLAAPLAGALAQPSPRG